MIQKFVDRFMDAKPAMLAKFRAGHPESYRDIVEAVVRVVGDDEYGAPDPSRIHEIDDGDYQGTRVYIIGENGYQPYTYWYVRISYGSCSGCDTLEALRGDSDDAPTDEQADGYWTLALHIVQGLKEMGDDASV